VKNVIIAAMIAATLCCAEALPIIRTILDVATILCEVTAEEQPKDELGGLTPAQWCSIPENVQPFLDGAKAAQEEAAGKAGFAP
jgi:hypothetical protein